ncbi:MAG: amino acid deaminase/aldolase, partial [Brachybacterium sp.]
MGRAGREFRDLESLLAREGYHERPLAVLDLDAFDANAADLARRAAGTPLRVASKSLRVRGLLERVL